MPEASSYLSSRLETLRASRGAQFRAGEGSHMREGNGCIIMVAEARSIQEVAELEDGATLVVDTGGVDVEVGESGEAPQAEQPVVSGGATGGVLPETAAGEDGIEVLSLSLGGEEENLPTFQGNDEVEATNFLKRRPDKRPLVDEDLSGEKRLTEVFSPFFKFSYISMHRRLGFWLAP